MAGSERWEYKNWDIRNKTADAGQILYNPQQIITRIQNMYIEVFENVGLK